MEILQLDCPFRDAERLLQDLHEEGEQPLSGSQILWVNFKEESMIVSCGGWIPPGDWHVWG